MPQIAPTSTIELYSGVEITNGQQVVFASASGQNAYFQARVALSSVNCSYVRKTGRLKVEAPASKVANCNYIGFRNASFENRVFFARIVNWEYINNVTTEIAYEIDYFQTYMFDVTYDNALIVREHLSETDFQKAAADPWDNSIYEFQTNENLAISEDMFEISSDEDVAIPNLGPNYAVLCIATWAETGGEEETWYSLLSENCTWGIRADGDSINAIPVAVGVPPFKFPMLNPFDVVVIEIGDDYAGTKTKLKNILNYMTVNNITEELLGIYLMPYFILGVWLNSTDSQVWNGKAQIALPDFSGDGSYVNKKLYRSPFAFCECVADSNIKEYKYENFSDRSDDSIKFTIVGSLDNIPIVSILPMNYKTQFTAPEGSPESWNGNLLERIDINNIPQIAFTIDSYLAFIGQQYQQVLSQTDAVITTNESVDALETGGVFDHGISGILPNLINKGKYVVNAVGSWVNPRDNMSEMLQREADRDLRSEAANAMTNTSGDYVSNVFGKAQNAYALHEYHAGTGNTIPLYAGFTGSPSGFYFLRRSLKPVIGAVYDYYFSEYGYTSNRVGVPRVCNYIKQSGDQPHFQGPATYCKTTGMKVISPMKTVSDYIEGVFNGGCKFLKGD